MALVADFYLETPVSGLHSWADLGAVFVSSGRDRDRDGLLRGPRRVEPEDADGEE